jgi:hypothetical protein
VVADPTLRTGWPRNFGRVTGDNVTLADLDGDGGKEIVFLAENRLYALRGDGSHLPGWPRTPDTQSFRAGPPSVADLDGDDSPEVVTPLHNAIDVRHADGTFVAAVNPGAYPAIGAITLADIDRDGRRDFVFGTSQTGQAIRSDGTQIPSFPVSPFGGHLCDRVDDWDCFEAAAAVGDVDGDGRLEAAFINNDGRGRQYLHVVDDFGDLLPRFPKKASKRHFFDNAPVMADLDGDGRLEVMVNGDGSRLIAWTHDAHRRKLPARGKLPDHVAGKWHAEQEPVTAGDLDGDGLAEVLVARAYAGAIIRRGEMLQLTPPYSGRHFLVALSQTLSFPGWSHTFEFPFGERIYGPGTPAIGDIDGDGGQDVVVGSGTCGLWERYDDPTLRRCYTVDAFRAADGSQLPGFPKPTARAGRSRVTTPALGDLDGDGLKEIVWIDGRDNILVWTIPGTPGPENMQWPMYRHDAAHTGALVPNP